MFAEKERCVHTKTAKPLQLLEVVVAPGSCGPEGTIHNYDLDYDHNCCNNFKDHYTNNVIYDLFLVFYSAVTKQRLNLLHQKLREI